LLWQPTYLEFIMKESVQDSLKSLSKLDSYIDLVRLYIEQNSSKLDKLTTITEELVKTQVQWVERQSNSDLIIKEMKEEFKRTEINVDNLTHLVIKLSEAVGVNSSRFKFMLYILSGVLVVVFGALFLRGLGL